MPNFKVVITYTQPDKSWSEVYYRVATDLGKAAAFPIELKTALVANKQALTIMRKARVSDVANNRQTQVVSLGNLPGDFGGTPDVTGTAAKVILSAPSTGASRKVWLRGLNDNAVARTASGGQDAPSGLLTAAITRLCQQLETQGFAIRSLTKIVPLTNPYYPITTITPIGPGITRLTFSGPIQGIPTTPIIVSQVNQKNWPGLKGTFVVLAQIGQTIDIAYTGKNFGTAVPTAPGRFRQGTFLYGGIVASLSGFDSFGTRATGKNSLGGRGARRGNRGFRLASAL